MHNTVLSAFTKRISRKIDKSIFGYGLIQPGDRILIGLSGGKDSVTLMHQLAMKAGGFSIDFTVEAIHIRTEYADDEGVVRLRSFCGEHGVVLHERVISVTGRLKPGRRMNCYWCSTQRRTELLRFAREQGFNRIALGHHMDDILETLLMNMTHKAEISTMLPLLRYDSYEQWIIRPLAWVTEAETEEYARRIGFTPVRCRCGFDTTSRRKSVRRTLEAIIEIEGEGAREKLMRSLHNVEERYMPRFLPREEPEPQSSDSGKMSANIGHEESYSDGRKPFFFARHRLQLSYSLPTVGRDRNATSERHERTAGVPGSPYSFQFPTLVIAKAPMRYAVEPTVRLATPRDLERLTEITAAAIEAMRRSGIDQWDEGYPAQSDLRLDIEAESLHVLTGDKDIWAFVTVDENTSPEWGSVRWQTRGKVLSIHKLTVDPKRQRMGLATQLLTWIEEFAVSHGYDAIHLDAFSENPAALRLYETLSYSRAGIVQFRKGDFVCYEKALIRTA